MIALYIVLAILAVLVAVIFIRTLLFVPKKTEALDVYPVTFDREKAAASLSEMIKCKTVSDKNPENEDEGEFEKFKMLLPTLFPLLHEKCEFSSPNKRALLYRWQGKSEKNPTVLMAHYDVVSADEEKWERPAFSGEVEGGFVYGRGTLDTKGTLNGILFAAESLMKEGFVPENDIYFAFAGDEEISGEGANSIVRYITGKGIEPALVVDEGGAIISDLFPGVSEKCAVVGIAEKGMLNVEYSVNGGGGHASAPPRVTPAGILARAVLRVEGKPFPFRLTLPVKEMINTLGRKSTFFYRLIFSNMWFFAPILNFIAKRSGGQTNAMFRTTLAFTEMEGSHGLNVIPPRARMTSNLRIMPGESMESALLRIKRTVNDGRIEIKALGGQEPSAVSSLACEAYRRVEKAIKESFGGLTVSPYLMPACSDSRHWSRVSDKVYRFSPYSLTKEENAGVHGNNERISIDNVSSIVEFYYRLMKKS